LLFSGKIKTFEMGKRKRGEEKPKVEGEYDLPAKAMKAVHGEGNKKRLIVVLHGAQLETVKVSVCFLLASGFPATGNCQQITP
jgi:hypothetical protein